MVDRAFSREEIEEAFKSYLHDSEQARKQGDWSGWADHFTEDAVLIDCELGTYRGREAIRTWLAEFMQPFPDMSVEVDWFVIEGNRVIHYHRDGLPHPEEGGEPFLLPCVSILDYAGEGLWSYEEDIYNGKEAERQMTAYAAAAAAVAARADAPA